MDDADLDKLLASWQGHLAKVVDDLKLRQWAIEMAMKERERNPGVVVVSLAQEIYAFITTSATQPFVPPV